MLQRLPVGIQTFSELRNRDCLYVDKTETIAQLLNQGKYFFLSRPRRFGKSLLLSTIKEISQGNRALFEGLWTAYVCLEEIAMVAQQQREGAAPSIMADLRAALLASGRVLFSLLPDTPESRRVERATTVMAQASMIHRGVLWCDLRLVEPQDGWILAVGVLIRPGCPGGCRFHCGGLLVLSVGRWFGGYWGQPGWRDQMRVQALTRSSAQVQSSGSFKIW